MGVVRSKELGRITSAVTGTTTIYTCPIGMTAIVKGITVAKTGPVAQTVTVSSRRSGTDFPFWIVDFAIAAGSALLLPWLVLEPGDELRVGRAASSAMTVIASGAELAGVAP